MLDEKELAAIRARMKGATPGKWRVNYHMTWDYDTKRERSFVTVSAGRPFKIEMLRTKTTEANAIFIASARSDIASLLDHVEALEAKIAELEGRGTAAA